jgi:energy-coupling factor transporter ATP-binding protein EcfA2
LNAGEISVLEGPNGSGKLTLMLCQSGLMRLTTGEIPVDGHDLYADESEAKWTLAFMPDVPHFYAELTAWEHLRFLVLAEPHPPFGWLAAGLLPFLVANTALGSVLDILDNVKTRVLLTPGLAEENVPRQDIQRVLTVLISVGLLLGLLVWG